MTIDPLGIYPAARPERGYAAQGAAPSTVRTPATTTATAATTTTTTTTADTADAAGKYTGPTDELKDAVGKLNASVHAQNLEFSIDEDSKRTVVKVVDSATKEVVRQMPTEEALEIAKALDKAFGLLISEKA
ncbi:flagellar protein FlaG [Pseudoduganella lutea]|uniref:Flagellar protein FlaG n=1 Tax=Pseudoduganella lutea TaxID=321985 RepID=A0A4P6L0S7_9BURK|nr:flagellar protein FlaG [Pseudoduganella lutea]QBE64854.1 flagellar protein FlaG [Pseudoduganella lutea]